MTINASLVQHGTVGGTAINADVSRIDHSVAVKVRLTSNYNTSRAPGAPSRPSFTGAPAANLDSPKTIASGTVLSLLKHEADALVTAGAATYA